MGRETPGKLRYLQLRLKRNVMLLSRGQSESREHSLTELCLSASPFYTSPFHLLTSLAISGNSNGVLPFGSDFPVERVNPLRGFYAAVARLSPETGESPHGPGGWYVPLCHLSLGYLTNLLSRFPDQKLTRAEALRGMTRAAAYASFAEKELGTLEPGKKADFVVLDRDIMTVPQEEIMQTKVRYVVVNGGVVWKAKEEDKLSLL
jgi:hypothetical protein